MPSTIADSDLGYEGAEEGDRDQEEHDAVHLRKRPKGGKGEDSS